MIKRKDLTEIVGNENVFFKQAILEAYSGDFSFVNRIKPAFVVRVVNVNNVEKLVNLARRTTQ